LAVGEHITGGLVEPELRVQIPQAAQFDGRIGGGADQSPLPFEILLQDVARDRVEQAIRVAELTVDGRGLDTCRGGHRPRRESFNASRLQQVGRRSQHPFRGRGHLFARLRHVSNDNCVTLSMELSLITLHAISMES
jgi:hypothetical protein